MPTTPYPHPTGGEGEIRTAPGRCLAWTWGLVNGGSYSRDSGPRRSPPGGRPAADGPGVLPGGLHPEQGKGGLGPQPAMVVPGCALMCPLLRVPTWGRAVPAELASSPRHPPPSFLPMLRTAMHVTNMPSVYEELGLVSMYKCASHGSGVCVSSYFDRPVFGKPGTFDPSEPAFTTHWQPSALHPEPS